MSAHAIYSPSSCYRNLSCVGSLAMIKKSGLVQKPSVYAEEGTLYHDWISKARTAAFRRESFDYDQIEDQEMRRHVQESTKFAIQLYKEFRKTHRDTKYFIETRVKFDDDLWGTLDLAFVGVRVADGAYCCVIIDDKYGKGVEVEAEDNEQLICYNLCLQKTLDTVFHFTHFFIYQPRIPGKEFTPWSVRGDVMLSSCKQILNNKEKALSILKLYEEKGTLSEQNLVAGEWCRFCPAKNACPSYLADLNSTQLKILDEVPEVPPIEILTIEQKIEVFKRRKTIKKFVDDICADLLETALKGGVPGYKIVEGQRRRKWKDQEGIGNHLVDRGVTKPFKQTLIGIGEVEKQIGKGKIDDLTELSKPSYQLVPENDKRQEVKQIGLEDLGEIEL